MNPPLLSSKQTESQPAGVVEKFAKLKPASRVKARAGLNLQGFLAVGIARLIVRAWRLAAKRCLTLLSLLKRDPIGPGGQSGFRQFAFGPQSQLTTRRVYVVPLLTAQRRGDIFGFECS